MPTTKENVIMNKDNLLTLAEKFTDDDFKRYDWMKEENRQHYLDNNLEHLQAVKRALLDGRFYIRVDSVAKSGMSRTISIAYIDDNKLHHVQDEIYKLAGCNSQRRISGCGMDMLFAAQYNLWHHLCSELPYQQMPRYNSL